MDVLLQAGQRHAQMLQVSKQRDSAALQAQHEGAVTSAAMLHTAQSERAKAIQDAQLARQ